LKNGPRQTMLCVRTCSFCRGGNVGVRVAASGEVVGLCDECESVWMDRELLDGPYDLEDPGLPCPGGGASLVEAPSHWATRAEAAAAGWDAGMLKETLAL